MARLIKPLTATQVSNARPKAKMYKLFDGGGLFLQVNPSGGKHWKMKYRKNDGKESLLTFGNYPALSLEQARKMRDEARSQKALGIDPGDARQEEKAERAKRARNTFEAVTREWMEIHSTKIKPQSMHIYEVLLDKFVFPLMGKKPIGQMKGPDFLELLRGIEAQGQLYSAKRIAIVCGMIMRFAVATGRAEIDPLPSVRGCLRVHKTKHFVTMTDPKEVGRLLRAIDAYPGGLVVSSALKIAPYVFVRPGELQQAGWADIDFKACEWRYTTSKTGTPHIVPLAPQVMKILNTLYAYTGHQEWLFPHQWQKGKSMAKTALLAALRSMGITAEEMTPHGFRAMARTLLDEVLGERYDLIEHQLAHMVRDPNGRAYNRTQHLAERHRMMERWAVYLDNLRAGRNEIPPFDVSG